MPFRPAARPTDVCAFLWLNIFFQKETNILFNVLVNVLSDLPFAGV